MKLLFWVAALSITSLSQAQVILNRDSLWNEVQKSNEDTVRVNLYIQLGQQYENNNPDSAILLYEQALKLSEKLRFASGIIQYYTNVTYVYNTQGRYDTSLVLNLKSIAIAREFGNETRLASCLANTGASYMALGNYQIAIEYYQQALPILESKRDTFRIQVLYTNLVYLYTEIKQLSKAVEFGELSLSIARQSNNQLNQLTVLVNLSTVYIMSGLYDKALSSAEESLSLARKLNHSGAVVASLLNMSTVHMYRGDYLFIKKYYDEALPIAEAIEDHESLAVIRRGLGIYYFHRHNLSKARHCAQQSFDLSLKFSFKEHMLKAYRLLADVEIAGGDFKKADRYVLDYDSLQQLIFNEATAKNIQDAETKYETAEKTKQIETLQQQAVIRSLSLKQARLWTSILGLLFVSSAIIFYLIRKSLIQRRELLNQENELKGIRIEELEKEKQLTASRALIQGEEQERSRLAKDLHDGLGGLLSGVKISLSNMKGDMTMTNDNVLVFDRSLDMLDTSIQELRRVSHNMMPESLMKFGLATAIRDFCDSINGMKALKVTFQKVGEERRIDSSSEIILYRLVQELLNNSLKHSGAHSALVQLAFESTSMSLTVEDDGKGFEIVALEDATGSGWPNIKSRVEYLKGKLDVSSQPGEGTSVHIRLLI